MEGEQSAPGGIVSEGRVRCALDVAAATWLLEANDLDGARRVLESALGSLPHDVRARSMLAQVHFRKRDFIAASELYERLLCEFRGDLTLTFNLALCQLKSGRSETAAAGFQRILDVRPDHGRARVWLGVAEAAAAASSPRPAAPSVAPQALQAFPVAQPPSPALAALASAPGSVPPRASIRPSRLDELPRVTLPPTAALVKDATGVVSVRVDGGTLWVARPDALQGYEGKVTVVTRAASEVNGPRAISVSGDGTAFLRGAGAMIVIVLRDEETSVRASSLVAHEATLVSEATDPEVVGHFDERIVRFSGTGTIVLEAPSELVALPVSLTHATTVRWDNVVGWTGHVIGAPSDSAGADGRALARFAGNGSLLLAMRDDGAMPSVMPGREGQEWYGRYQVLKRLDGTPAEDVLLARSHGPGGFQRTVILKRHLARYDGDSHFLQLLAREADAYARLTHPGIVRLYDFLLLDGHPVLVLEYVSGISLAAMDAALREQHRSLGNYVSLFIAHGILSALAAAHEARDPDSGEIVPVIHRDVRPANLLLSWSGDVKVASFATMKTSAQGERERPFTVSTDVYAAARLVHEMLANGRAVDPAGLAPANATPRLEDLEAIGPHLRQRLRDALRAALVTPGGPGASAGTLAREIEAVIDLKSARQLCLEELTSLRESAFRGMTHSSRPPPPETENASGSGDTGFFRSLRLPKAAPLPQIAGDVWPSAANGASAARGANDTSEARTSEGARETSETNAEAIARVPTQPSLQPSGPVAVTPSLETFPPIQQPSFGPGVVRIDIPREASRARRTTFAVIGAVAFAAGVAIIGWAPQSGGGGRSGGAVAASEPRAPEKAPDLDRRRHAPVRGGRCERVERGERAPRARACDVRQRGGRRSSAGRKRRGHRRLRGRRSPHSRARDAAPDLRRRARHRRGAGRLQGPLRRPHDSDRKPRRGRRGSTSRAWSPLAVE